MSRSPDMPYLQALIKRVRGSMEENYEKEQFLPYAALRKIESDIDLGRCLHEARGLSHLLRREAENYVRKGGLKTFLILAILQDGPRIDLIERFLRSDQMIGRDLDSRLPFESRDSLYTILDDECSSDFYKQQWAFVAPIFREDRSHRTLHPETILPFSKDEFLDNGGYGRISKVTVCERHSAFNQIYLARKKIDLPDQFDNETRILRLLRQHRHDNVIQILASFSIGSKNETYRHSLLMPLAKLSMAKLFNKEIENPIPSLFSSESHIFRELYGLCSALESLHFYEDAEESVRLQGCHLDLAPRNILLDKDRLLLADFGISRMRNETSNSCTPFKGGRGPYQAPECFLEGGRHGRSSDIWSFGCILAVFVVFLKRGYDGLNEFKVARKHERNGGTVYDFHTDGEVNQGAATFMDALGKGLSQEPLNHLRGVISTARWILQVDTLKRPAAKRITAMLYLISQRSWFCCIDQNLFELRQRSESLELRIEQARFTIWSGEAGLSISDYDDPVEDVEQRRLNYWLLRSGSEYRIAANLLCSMYEETELLGKLVGPDEPISPVFQRLRSINDQLWNLCPTQVRVDMCRSLSNYVTQLVQDDGIDNLTDLPGGDHLSTTDKAIWIAAIKYKTSESYQQTHAGNPRMLQKSQVKRTSRKLGPHEIVELEIEESIRLALCEWVHLDRHMISVAPERLFGRIEQVAQKLSISPVPPDFRVLNCVGYYDCTDRLKFGLLFSTPAECSAKTVPASLEQILKGCSRPPLGFLFFLAQTIVKTLLFLHKADWLHKSLCSYNILFFDDSRTFQNIATQSPRRSRKAPSEPVAPQKTPKKGFLSKLISSSPSKADIDRDATSYQESPPSEPKLPLETLPSPYVIGFNHSRPNDPNTFTRRLGETASLYQHHRYAEDPNQHFSLGFDYYSVGLLLLEIGGWRPLDSPLPDNRDPKLVPLIELQQIWSTQAKELAVPMGAKFSEAVHLCLSDTLINCRDGEALDMFEVGVVNKLLGCAA